MTKLLVLVVVCIVLRQSGLSLRKLRIVSVETLMK